LSIEKLHNESILVQEMQDGSEQAFTTLYMHYSPLLYTNILKMVRDTDTAEEIVQELFVRIWQKRDKIGMAENFSGYMFRIAQNLVLDFYRKVQRDRSLLNKFQLLVTEQQYSEEEDFKISQSSGQLKKAIDQLPPQQKKVFELVKLEGHTYKKAAVILGISPLTVKEYIVSANKSIRSYLAKYSFSPLPILLFELLYSNRF
jgi:RNA polymerase sigma-70 factor (family 1)